MVPLTDLCRQYESLQDEMTPAALRAMASGHYILGPEVEAFEAEFAAYCGVKHAVAVGSGTDAIRLTLIAAGITHGDEVITVAFTAVPTVAAVVSAGAVPVFVDIDPDSLVMDVSRVEAMLTERTKAILPVHLYGFPVNTQPLVDLASGRGLTVIEDACQAHGSEYNGRKAGGIGHAACFSFYPTKNLGGFGDGGMVVTNDDGMAAKVRLLRNHGQTRRFHHVVVSPNSRFDDLQAAVLRVKLRHLDEWNERRRLIAERYHQALQRLPLSLLPDPRWGRSNHHLYVVRAGDRESFRRRLEELGVATDVHYPLPVHLQPAFRNLGWGPGSLPVSERAAASVVTLPLFPELTEEEIEQVIRAVSLAAEPAPALPEGKVNSG